MKKNDISVFEAILFLILCIGVFFGIKYYKIIVANFSVIRFALESSMLFIMLYAFVLISNIILITTLLKRLLGYKKQGSRLRALKNQKKGYKNEIIKFFCAVLASNLVYLHLQPYAQDMSKNLLVLFNKITYSYIVESFSLLWCFFMFILSYGLWGLLSFIKKALKIKKKLTSFPKLKNHLTLGSVGEEKGSFDEVDEPKWLVIPQKALCGNILISGSIGSGKTQGTILTYLQQLFSKFKNTPSALVLDPKGSFTPEVIKMLKELDLEDKVICLGDSDAFSNI